MITMLLYIVWLLNCRVHEEKERESGKKKKTWYKSKAQAKRLIILQQKWVRMVGLHLYTLPFVQAVQLLAQYK